jgi:hypothetical protein
VRSTTRTGQAGVTSSVSRRARELWAGRDIIMAELLIGTLRPILMKAMTDELRKGVEGEKA